MISGNARLFVVATYPMAKINLNLSLRLVQLLMEMVHFVSGGGWQ